MKKRSDFLTFFPFLVKLKKHFKIKILIQILQNFGRLKSREKFCVLFYLSFLTRVERATNIKLALNRSFISKKGLSPSLYVPISLFKNSLTKTNEKK